MSAGRRIVDYFGLDGGDGPELSGRSRTLWLTVIVAVWAVAWWVLASRMPDADGLGGRAPFLGSVLLALCVGNLVMGPLRAWSAKDADTARR